MRLMSWIRDLCQSERNTRRRGAAIRKRSFRPSFDVLEGRAVPATLVTTNLDSLDFTDEAVSLREAIATTPSGDTIAFNLGTNPVTISLTGGPLVISGSLTIQGPGDGQLTISGDHASAVFSVNPGAQLQLEGLTIRDSATGIANGGSVS